MKKILGISLVAVLAVSPLMANAAAVTGAPTSFSNDAEASALTAATAGTTPKYQLAQSAGTDNNAASAGYVKGAYNAAIKAVNAVHDEVVTGLATKQASLTAGDGIDITNNVVSVDLTSNDGLEVAEGKLGIKDGAGIKTGSNGVEVDLKSNGGLTTDTNGQLTVVVDDTTIDLDNSGKIHLKNGIQNATDTTNHSGTGLTTQGYVEEYVASAVSTGTTGMAKQVGVEETIKDVTISQGAVTQGLTGTPTTSTITVMTSWADDTSHSDVTAITGLGTLTTNVSVANPTINADSVHYTEQ